MTIFWILAAGLAFLAVLFAVAPHQQPSQPTDATTPSTSEAEAEQARVNLPLFKQQLTELAADLDAGTLDHTV